MMESDEALSAVEALIDSPGWGLVLERLRVERARIYGRLVVEAEPRDIYKLQGAMSEVDVLQNLPGRIKAELSAKVKT